MIRDKQNKIIEAAKALFAVQGPGKTTVSEITAKAGVSKGAFYLYFSSKSALLIQLLEEMDEDLQRGLHDILSRDDLTPKEKLRLQFKYQLQDSLELQRQMESYMLDAGLSLDEELMLLAQKTRSEFQAIQEAFLELVYGQEVLPFITDLSVSVSGVLNEYFLYIMLEKIELDLERVVHLMMDVVDSLANGLKTSAAVPVITKMMLPGREELEQSRVALSKKRVNAALEDMMSASKELPAEEQAEVRETIETMREELSREEPRPRVLQGLLANLREFKQLLSYRQSLASEWKVKLI